METSSLIDQIFEDNNFDKNGKVKTLRNRVYFIIRDAILEQRLKPNQRIHEKDIAEKLGVSGTPVREALFKLEVDGFILIQEHRGATVRSLSHSELVELYEVISVLDAFAHKMACEYMDELNLNRLKEFYKKLLISFDKKIIEDYLNINASFLRIVWKLSGNKSLGEHLEQVYLKILRYKPERLFICSKPEILKNSLEGYRLAISAFQSKDCSNIENIVRNRWNIAGIKKYLKSFSETD